MTSTRVERASVASSIHGRTDVAIRILDSCLDGIDDGDVASINDLAIARERIRLVRDRMYDQVRRDTEALARLELELERDVERMVT